MKAFLSFLFVISLQLCCGVTRDDLFPFGDQNGDQKLLSNADDVSSPEIQLSVPIVNDNGIVSFLTEVPSFFNSQFPLSYPIIAAMETTTPDLLERANRDIVRHFSRAKHFKAQTLFIVTWSDVGRYDQKTSPTNTAQVVIATNGTESYVYLLYPTNAIQWIQGEGKISNLPDARTQAGFMSGDGRFHSLRGSGTEQIRNFDKMSNVFRPGVWLFLVGNLGNGNVVEPDIDGNQSLQKPELDTCATAQLPCPPNANCIDYAKGFCCQCSDGYFGNGRQCLVNKTTRLGLHLVY
ncbi:unnamed protein product [Oppiella nova]|uniref:NIDO domain-containing protein n=1 Tax=Oppiella nova TaxID=334625 RepID=A0A7R9QGA2_9ACAR|nr:unnamed protein product [Oppiella nova]CAG2164802.1 unnamed protein product [Oppiella nova]